MSERKGGQYLIQIGKDDITEIFTKELGMKPNVFSPFYEYGTEKKPVAAETGEGGEQPGAEVNVEAIRSILADPVFVDIAKVLAYPQIKVRIRTGGGTVNLEESYLLGRNDCIKVALVNENIENAFYIQIFDSIPDYTKWWTDAYAGGKTETVANYIPPDVSIGELIFILHAIDYYRRASYTSMLEYTPSGVIKIDTGDFATAMEKALRSRDIRWLLPAFAIMTPGLEKFTADIKLDDIAVLYAKNFLGNIQVNEGSPAQVVFGEAAKIMGTEFMRTWMICAGFEMNIFTPDGVRDGGRFFIAPTGLTNHLIYMKPVKESLNVNHQALTTNHLDYMMKEILGALKF
ncbi:MAG: hypothetical protein PHG48_02760 [Eubacteriales bacterium]|nr:hypothetical protein [Eubacteriales bacterium]